MIALTLTGAIMVLGCNANCPANGKCSWDEKNGVGSFYYSKEYFDYAKIYENLWDSFGEYSYDDLTPAQKTQLDELEEKMYSALCGVTIEEEVAKCDC